MLPIVNLERHKMRRHQAACFFLVLGIVLVDFNSAWGVQTETLRFGRFGTGTVYRESPHPCHVVLFISGDGGWNLGVVDMASAPCTLCLDQYCHQPGLADDFQTFVIPVWTNILCRTTKAASRRDGGVCHRVVYTVARSVYLL